MVVVCIAIACGTSAVNWYCIVILWYCGICGIYGIAVLGVCVCGASAVRLRCARGTPAVRRRHPCCAPIVEWLSAARYLQTGCGKRRGCGSRLQRDSCRLVAVKVGVAVVVRSLIAADWLW